MTRGGKDKIAQKTKDKRFSFNIFLSFLLSFLLFSLFSSLPLPRPAVLNGEEIWESWESWESWEIEEPKKRQNKKSAERIGKHIEEVPL